MTSFRYAATNRAKASPLPDWSWRKKSSSFIKKKFDLKAWVDGIFRALESANYQLAARLPQSAKVELRKTF